MTSKRRKKHKPEQIAATRGSELTSSGTPSFRH